MKRYEQLRVLSLLTFAILLWSNTVAAQVTKPKTRIASEGFSFLLKDFRMDHQGEVNNLNLAIRYRYKAPIANSEYPDFRAVAGEIESLLKNYPNKTDYWEIVNKRITLLVLEKYPAIAQVTSEIQVSPSPKVGYERSSIMTRDRR